MELSDRQLVGQYRDGDVGALEVLVQKHRRSLFGFILNMTGSDADANDVFQETWLRAIRNVDRYQEGNFGGWIFRIARNIVIDRVRRKKPSLSLDQAPPEGRPLAETLPGKDPGPSRHAEAGDLGKALAQAVASLPEEQREVFLMRVEADLPFKEIAAIQKVSINTALARMQYALAKLRPLLKAEYEGLAG